MAVAFDKFTGTTLDATSPGSITHTPVGTPKAAIAITFKDNNSGPATAVTYGGVDMTQVSGSPNGKSATEAMEVGVWFLGSGIPTGAQTVSFTYGAAGIYMSCITLTASTDTEIVTVDATINSNASANPSVTLSLGGRTSFCCINLASGQGAVSGITPLTSWTNRAETDDGLLTYGVYTYDTIGTADVTAGWTQTSDDAVAIALAISEVSGGGGGRTTKNTQAFNLGSETGTNLWGTV